jgi:hypothetical protein
MSTENQIATSQKRDLFQASSYRLGYQQFPGKVHLVDDECSGRLMCGKKIKEVAGQLLRGFVYSVDCKGCLRASESRKNANEWKAKLDREIEERDRLREEKLRWYREVYLKSPEWRSLREKVLKRANYVCEGCGEKAATQAHHLTYDRVGGRDALRSRRGMPTMSRTDPRRCVAAFSVGRTFLKFID